MSFTSLFYQHIMFRRSCEVCHFTNLQRPSDITLADFWGWEKTDPTLNADNKGVSLVFCNTEKGRKLFEAVSDRMKTIPVSLENAMQPNLQHPTLAHPKREAFEQLYAKKGFVAAYRRYGEDSVTFKIRLKRYLRAIKTRINQIVNK